MKILITGSNGLLGQKLKHRLRLDKDVKLYATSIGKNRVSVKDDYEYFKHKFGLFILGIITIIISEISIKYSSTNTIQNIHIYSLPILFLVIFYLYIKLKLKKPNLIRQ